jgi:WhiB family redox-sensing transcriptional regulator
MDDAVCAQIGVNMFFPIDGDAFAAKTAKRICSTCPVMDECLEYALSFQSMPGIYGGTTQHERNKIKLQRRRSL